jgi:chromosomal replication initiation ATPase DnaA
MQAEIPKCSMEALVFLCIEHKKNRKPVKITIEQVFNEVCEIFAQEPKKVKSKNRGAKNILCRSIISYVCCRVTNSTLKEIGEYLGRRDHTTIIHNRNKIANFLSVRDGYFMRDWEIFTSQSKLWNEYLKTTNTV